jgi:7-cyano-7-deazaguanine synthase
MGYKAVVCHSGGMDSSICLAQAVAEHGAEQVLSMSFHYEQRHAVEVSQAKKICQTWGVRHTVLDVRCLLQVTSNALMNPNQAIEHQAGDEANTLVVGRNGLMMRLAAIHAAHLGADRVYSGIIEVEAHYSGYRDSTRAYADLLEQVLRVDLANPKFRLITPVVFMTKAESLHLAQRLGVLDFLLEETVSCYEGLFPVGCGRCPACHLREEGVKAFRAREGCV